MSLDLAGKVPSADELALFTLDPDPSKRSSNISSLLAGEDYPEAWGRYWRDVIAYEEVYGRAVHGERPCRCTCPGVAGRLLLRAWLRRRSKRLCRWKGPRRLAGF